MNSHTKEILTFIGRNPQGASFYQIIRVFGFPDAPYNLPAILNSFVEENLSELDKPEAGANARYVITIKGIQAIATEKE